MKKILRGLLINPSRNKLSNTIIILIEEYERRKKFIGHVINTSKDFDKNVCIGRWTNSIKDKLNV